MYTTKQMTDITLLNEWNLINSDMISILSDQTNLNSDIIERESRNYSDLLDDYIKFSETAREINRNEFESHNETLLSGQTNLNSDIIERESRNYSDLLDDYIRFSETAREKNQKYSCDFNVFDMFNINEPTHSYLISHLLDPNASHGQGILFLKTFLHLIEIEHPEKGQWIVTAEKGRIDILLKRFKPHSIIIIENKSNYAKDQENQLYRYWFQEIYYPNRHRHIDFANQCPGKYQIIYLTPASWKLPNDNTLSKPDDWADDLPKKIPMEPKIIEFGIHIVKWLRNSLDLIPSTNNRLNEYVKQYIELWS
jgi:hypothetical protein